MVDTVGRSSSMSAAARHYLDTKHLVKTDAVGFAAKTTAFNWLLSCAVLRSLYRAKLLRVFIAIEVGDGVVFACTPGE
jgi:hypothetical protein